MQSKRGKLTNDRQAVLLCSGLEKSLAAYASAALAAGVSVLVMTNSAQARIVYTPAHTKIPLDNRVGVPLDLNHDGVADFSFRNYSVNFAEGQFFTALNVGCAVVPVSHHNSSTCRYQSNEIWGRGTVSGRFASALGAGLPVRANKSYFQQGRRFATSSRTFGPVAEVAGFFGYGSIGGSNGSASRTSGQWLYTRRRYLGLKFIIGGQVHYGWARLAVTLVTLPKYEIQAILTGYAYETVPDKPIITGKTKGPDVITLEPVTLGRLAQGASGILTWREKK